MIYLSLFLEFFKTGLFSIGGGLATIPFLQDMAARTGWFTSAELANMIAVAESTPGPIGINTATYVGYTVGISQYGSGAAGVFGAVVATMGVICPSIIVILIIAMFLSKFRTNKYVEAVFAGIRPCSVALIASAGVGIIVIAFFGLENIKELLALSFSDSGALSGTDAGTGTGVLAGTLFSWKYVVLAAGLVVATRFIPKVKDLHPIIFIAASAVVGVVFSF